MGWLSQGPAGLSGGLESDQVNRFPKEALFTTPHSSEFRGFQSEAPREGGWQDFGPMSCLHNPWGK